MGEFREKSESGQPELRQLTSRGLDPEEVEADGEEDQDGPPSRNPTRNAVPLAEGDEKTAGENQPGEEADGPGHPGGKHIRGITEQTGAKVAGFGFVIELSFLKGIDKLNTSPVYSLIKY